MRPIRRCEALVDTGACNNVVSLDLYNEIREHEASAIYEPLEPVSSRLFGANNVDIPLRGAVSLVVHVTATEAFTAKFFVAEALSGCDMLWGRELLGAHHLAAVIDLEQQTLHSRRMGLTLPLDMPTRRSWARKRRQRQTRRLSRHYESLQWTEDDKPTEWTEDDEPTEWHD